MYFSLSAGNVKHLKDLCAKYKDKFLQADGKGWIPLHAAAAQSNQTILEFTYKGLYPPDNFDSA